MAAGVRSPGAPAKRGATLGPMTGDDRKLRGRVLLRVVLGVILIGALIFGPAGGLDFWPGWMFMVAIFSPMLAATAYLLRRDPALLQRRLRSGEPQPEQRRIIALTNLVFIAGLALPGLDHRFGWSQLPWPLIVAGNLGVVASYALIFRVLQTNSYASRTVTVDAEQQVIDTGPYAQVRHPMYSGMLAMMACAALGLGSLWTLLFFALTLPPLLWARLVSEERLLLRELPGYADYCQRVRWRLIPRLL